MERKSREFRPFRTFQFKKMDFLLIALVIALNIIGIMAIGSASPGLQMRQIEGTIIGIVIMVMASMIDYSKLIRFNWVFYFLNIGLLALVLIMGSSGGGAQRWINIGGITFQPSEAAKILLILFYAQFIMKYKDKMKTFTCLVACGLLAVPPLILIVRQPDLSTTIMVFIIIFVMLFVGGINWKIVAGAAIIAIPSFAIFMNLVLQDGQTILSDYQQGRILSWLHPEDYADTLAYQTMNSLMAIGSGRLLGKGYNTNEISSLLNSGYISESQTDFIFTVIGEEFGFVGSVAVVLLFLFITIRCFFIARNAKDLAGQVIAAGVGAWIGFQGFMNMGVTTGILPNTGIPLPFVSYGLTSLISLYLAIGIILNVQMQRIKQ